MQPGESMQEALRRLEAGEDPDKLDEEMGDLLDDDDSMFGGEGESRTLGRVARRLRPPTVDETLYDL
jgi:hypothetical protein